tara:strand:+ start:218 stop:391 length:174 start_codon:yes stop_codon:yes gene_type:complete
MYEYFDLGLIFINLLFCGLLLHRTNKLDERLTQIETLSKATAKSPKMGRKLLNEMEQ